MTQGVLSFQYQEERCSSGLTALGGLPAYLDLAAVSGLTESIERHVQVCGQQTQGWTDRQIVMALVLLNLAGGECVEDLRMLEKDAGFARILRQVETHGLARKDRRALERRWRKARRRAVPSPSAVFRYLAAFHDAEPAGQREVGRAFIPESNEHLRRLGQVNEELIDFTQRRHPQTVATLDQDATLVETHKRQALFSYQGQKAYQPLNTYWAEQDLVVHSEFRDGNVPAGYQQLRVLQQALGCLPEGVEKIYLRSDTAGYQHELLRYCAEGKHPRFGVIEFAIGVDVTPAFKAAVAEVAEGDWQPLYRDLDGQRIPTGQEWAEVCYVPAELGRKKGGAESRFLAIREPLSQGDLPGMETTQLPFPTLGFGAQGRYKLFGLVSNRTLAGQELITWHRGRCGKSEEVHAVMKDDLAGGQLPSGDFGENAAWWAIMILALNLNALMKHLALPKSWANKRLKAIRFGLIHVAGRVLWHARQLFIRLTAAHPALTLLVGIRQRIQALAQPPPG
jgi:hypothetical protein